MPTKKGINMSRIMRSPSTAILTRTFSFGVIEAALDDYKTRPGELSMPAFRCGFPSR